jgi:hypothetical protein
LDTAVPKFRVAPGDYLMNDGNYLHAVPKAEFEARYELMKVSKDA